MLEHLDIKNYALIENLSVDFNKGFNVITGETGAGKSIILGALGLLMGEKAEVSAVRNGADEITVDALISIPDNHEILPWLSEHGVVPEDNAIIIKRTVRPNGRSVIYVQGQLFSRADLTHLADSLIDMHGQSEHQSLLLPDRQRKILDSYSKTSEQVREIEACYRRINDLQHQLSESQQQALAVEQQKDYLSFALNEIEGANIVPNEDEQLKEKIDVLSKFETIFENVASCLNNLKSIKSCCYDALSSLSKAEKCDSALSNQYDRLESLKIEAEDISQALGSYIDRVDYSEETINQMQDRLSLLQRLKRKYGATLDDVLAFRDDAKSKLSLGQNFEEHTARIMQDIEEETEKYRKLAFDLSSKRKQSAQVLQKEIETRLRTLGMPDAVFEISVLTDNQKISANGFDSISFLICPNAGEQLKELRRIASGGELSRVMLALKTVLAGSDSIQTQIFDEVDSGIGGSIALSLADCIEKLSEKKQVIAITHLAVIASRAQSQFVVSKAVKDGRTFSELKLVKEEERVHEIARMLSGDENPDTLNHARRLLGTSV